MFGALFYSGTVSPGGNLKLILPDLGLKGLGFRACGLENRAKQLTSPLQGPFPKQAKVPLASGIMQGLPSVFIQIIRFFRLTPIERDSPNPKP